MDRQLRPLFALVLAVAALSFAACDDDDARITDGDADATATTAGDTGDPDGTIVDTDDPGDTATTPGDVTDPGDGTSNPDVTDPGDTAPGDLPDFAEVTDPGDATDATDTADMPDVVVPTEVAISGTVIGFGAVGPLEDVTVCIYQDSATPCQTTDASGTYRFDGIVPNSELALVFEGMGLFPYIVPVHVAIEDRTVDLTQATTNLANLVAMLAGYQDIATKGLIGLSASEVWPNNQWDGVARVQFALSDATATGPVYVNTAGAPDMTLTETTWRGLSGFGDVTPGVVELTATHPTRACFGDPLQWPGTAQDAIRLPIEAGHFTLADMVCEPVTDWACVGNVTSQTPSETDPGITVQLVDPADGALLQGVDVAVCALSDTACATPLSTDISDNDGISVITVPAGQTGFDGYIRFTGTGYKTTRLFYNPKIGASLPQLIKVPLLTAAEEAALATALGATVDPTRSTVLSIATDCSSLPAPDVVVDIAQGDASSITGYLSDTGLDPASAATDASGSAFTFNVPAGVIDVRANRTGEARHGTVATVVQSGEVAVVVVPPTP